MVKEGIPSAYQVPTAPLPPYSNAPAYGFNDPQANNVHHLVNPPTLIATVQPQPVVVAPVVNIQIVSSFGPESSDLTCPYCQKSISSKTNKSPSMTAYGSGCIIAILGCFCGCCLIPCCMDSCKTVEHSCPQCKAFLGKYSKYR